MACDLQPLIVPLYKGNQSPSPEFVRLPVEKALFVNQSGRNRNVPRDANTDVSDFENVERVAFAVRELYELCAVHHGPIRRYVKKCLVQHPAYGLAIIFELQVNESSQNLLHSFGFVPGRKFLQGSRRRLC